MTSKKTALYDKHVAMGAHMVEFKKTLLPLRFHSEIEEHAAVRNRVGIFDVSHMGEILIANCNAHDFLQGILTNNIDALAVGQAQYSLMLNDNAGIIDDLIVYRLAPNVYLLCINAGNLDSDWQYLNDQSKHFARCDLSNLSEQYSQFAVQGPNSAQLLQSITEGTLPPKFEIKSMDLAGAHTLVAHTGYTGEDGFEIFVKNSDAEKLYEHLLFRGQDFGLAPCGLAARDSLRLEAGLMLHGQDMDETTTPREVGLLFAVDLNKPTFVGKEKLLKSDPTRKLVGFKLLDRGIARHDFAVYDDNDNEIGKVTSATYLNNEKLAIGFAMINSGAARKGNKIFIDIRGRKVPAEVCSPRFLNHKGAQRE